MSHTLLTALLTRIGLLLLRGVIHLPLPLQHMIGHQLGKFAFRFSKKWRLTAHKNLSAAFPQLDTVQLEQLLHDHFRSLGIGLIEMASAWWNSDHHLKNRVTIDGLEYLEHAKEQGHGVILLSAHFTTLEIGGRLLSLFHPIHAMYREQDNPIFNQSMIEGRNSFLKGLIKKSDLRGMLKTLKENQAIWYAMDQNSTDSSAVFTRFFDIPCSTTAATSKLAQRSKAKVIPFSTRRVGDGGHYHLTIHPPLLGFPGEDPITDTQRILDLFETEIRKIPEQYLWVHRRFKTQPDGYPPFYSQ